MHCSVAPDGSTARTVVVPGGDGSTETRLRAKRAVVLATGTRSVAPAVPALDDVAAWDNRGAVSTTSIPRRLVVLGGGAVGAELAQAFRRLGSEQVTVVEAGPRLLAHEEPFASDEVRGAFEAEGIDVVVGARVAQVRRAYGGPATVDMEGAASYEADDLLVAAGRRVCSPRVTFTDPQVCAVGLTEVQARERRITVRALTYGTGDVPGAYTLGEHITGTSKLVGDDDRRVLVGATFTGPGVQELLHSATVAVAAAVPLDQLWHAVPAFPTVSEVWLHLLESYGL